MRRREFNRLLGVLILYAAGFTAAAAQVQQKVPFIIVVNPSEPVEGMSETGSINYRAFFQELRRLGYLEGRNIRIERRSGGGRSDEYPALARDIVSRQPDLIASASRRFAQLLAKETRSIPIVTTTDDPVAAGLAVSLSRPGGNVTGVSVETGRQVMKKRFELLRLLAPDVKTVALLGPAANWQGAYRADLEVTAAEADMTLIGATLTEMDEQAYRRAFIQLVQDGAGAVVTGDATENITNRRLIIGLATEHRLPAIYPYRVFGEAGGLMSYGIDTRELWRELARQVDRVLKGAHPGELPFFGPTKFELIINLKTAAALGLTVPHSLLARADEVIE